MVIANPGSFGNLDLGQAEKGGAKFKKKLGGASLRPLIKKKW